MPPSQASLGCPRGHDAARNVSAAARTVVKRRAASAGRTEHALSAETPPLRWMRWPPTSSKRGEFQPYREDRGAVGQGRAEAIASPSAARSRRCNIAATTTSFQGSPRRPTSGALKTRRWNRRGPRLPWQGLCGVVASEVPASSPMRNSRLRRNRRSVCVDRQGAQYAARCLPSWCLTSRKTPTGRGDHLGLPRRTSVPSHVNQAIHSSTRSAAERQLFVRIFSSTSESLASQSRQLQAMILHISITRSPAAANPSGCADHAAVTKLRIKAHHVRAPSAARQRGAGKGGRPLNRRWRRLCLEMNGHDDHETPDFQL